MLLLFELNIKIKSIDRAMLTKSTRTFIVCAILWEIAVAILYGLFIRYNQTSFTSMQGPSTVYYYNWSTSPTTSNTVQTNTTQMPFPMMVVTLAIVLLLVGFAMIAGYIERSSVQGMAFTILIFALTAQNFFIYRDFWERSGVNNPNSQRDFVTRYWEKINYSNQGNSLQSPYVYTSASFLDAVAAAIAMYVGYSAVIGRVGLGQIFFLTWIGPFFYECNSQLLWRFYWPDTGFPSRAFGFGSALALVSSLILGKFDLTRGNPHYSSRYKVMGLALLGIIFVWCSYPILLLASTYETTTSSSIVAETGQVNIWMALAASVLGVFSATSIYYKKFSVHELVFTSITVIYALCQGAIAVSSSTDIDYNTGGAIAIGFGVSFLCCLCQMAFKRGLNKNGVIESNSVIFHFLLPSFFAAIFSAITSGIGNTATTFTPINSAGTALGALNYNKLVQTGRSSQSQGGYQILAWLLSVGMGALGGAVIGLFYWLINDHDKAEDMFNDAVLINYPGGNHESYYSANYPPKQSTYTPQQQAKPQVHPAPQSHVMLNFDFAE